MDLGPITPATPLHAADAPWAPTGEAEASAGPGEPQAAAGTHTDLGSKTAVVQTFARLSAPPDAAGTHVDTVLPAAEHALSEFALPAAQLLPLAWAGLQVEHAWTRLPPHAPPHALDDAAPARDGDDATARGETAAGEPDDQDDADAATPDEPATDDAVGDVLDAPGDDDCAALSRHLNAALADSPLPRALAAAAEQWQRGRCVLLACPQGRGPGPAAWAFVLWPRRMPRPGAPVRTLAVALRGRRLEARLHWREAPRGARWCHARLIKEHHPQRGRQLVTLPTAGQPLGAPPCRVQLGPVPMPVDLAGEVWLRIDAVQRLWAALGTQWSVHLLVCSLPLAGAVIKDTPC